MTIHSMQSCRTRFSISQRANLVFLCVQILKRVQDDNSLYAVMLNLFQHLTASHSCLSLRTDPEKSSG